MGAVTLEDICLTPLARIQTEGGDVLHAMKNTDHGFKGFGEAYFSWVMQSSVKAWKRHLRMTMNLVVPVGSVRFVFMHNEDHSVREVTIGTDCYARLTVPPGIWFGFQGLAAPQSLVLNLANIIHDPDEVERLPASFLDYMWNHP